MSSFGDRVRIKQSPETVAAGVAGLEGNVFGFTTPSVTEVDVVGGAPDDRALNVSVDAHGNDLWFRPDLVEFLDHNVGMEMAVDNVRAVRQSDGSWAESFINSPSSSRTAKAPSTLLGRLKRLFTK